jgi:D-alanyl-D-alanine carboxypeptidase/D-alanyl-D-alanine-endopeptidase (penicillin-binding protein 4)
MSRPEYDHSRFGVAVYSLDDHKPIYELNAQQLFVAASVTKVFTVGTSLDLLGADYRFHTRVYRTGGVNASGSLDGDLVLVASGDPNLSNRLRPDGTLAFRDRDHTYSGDVVEGDPLASLRTLATQVAAHGIHKVGGRIAVDVSLFPEGIRELGTGVVISPIMVNDNVIDSWLTAGAAEGDPVTIRLSPDIGYIKVVNQLKTGSSASKPSVNMRDDRLPDGTRTVTVTGVLPVGAKVFRPYVVPEPSVFARMAFAYVLREAGVDGQPGEAPRSLVQSPERKVAELVSTPFSEEAKVTLKVSHNLHASMMPYLWGAISGKPGDDALETGWALERNFLTRAGLDLGGAHQSDGAGGDAYYSPDLVVHYLDYMSRQPFAEDFRKALPVLGVDGTLFDIQVKSPAAGKVFAKTGTLGGENALRELLTLSAKGLAGYTTTTNGRHVAFALFVNMVAGEPATVTHMAGEALGEIATAIWETGGE